MQRRYDGRAGVLLGLCFLVFWGIGMAIRTHLPTMQILLMPGETLQTRMTTHTLCTGLAGIAVELLVWLGCSFLTVRKPCFVMLTACRGFLVGVAGGMVSGGQVRGAFLQGLAFYLVTSIVLLRYATGVWQGRANGIRWRLMHFLSHAGLVFCVTLCLLG